MRVRDRRLPVRRSARGRGPHGFSGAACVRVAYRSERGACVGWASLGWRVERPDGAGGGR
nr:MAG TPA: hypothetical protein [Caudoviricetes sp.]